MHASRTAPQPLRGQSIVEFALVLPMFLLLMMGIIDFGRLLFSYVSLTNGTREMARIAAFPGSTTTEVVDAFNGLTIILGPVSTSPQDTVRLSVVNYTATQTVTVTCNMPPTTSCLTAAFETARSRASGGYVEVTSTHNFELNPIFGWFAGGTRPQLSTTVRSHAE